MRSNKTYNYVGWVPCLNGQLVFDLVECGLVDKSSYPINIIHQEQNEEKITEYILLSSTVNWKDFGGKDIEGLWTIILFSERTLSDKNHLGCIYLISKATNAKEKLFSHLTSIQELNYALNTGKCKNFISQFSEIEKDINLIHTDNCFFCYKAEFKLEENGTVWIGAEDNQNNQDGIGKIIARQSYYYIKYAWHKHQHHNNRAETLTTIHSFNKNEFTYERKIAEALIGDLKRNLVKFKREVDPTSYSDIQKAKGIISYAKALVEIMKSKNFITESHYKREQKHLGYFEDSLNVSYSLIEKNISSYDHAFGYARTMILFLFAMITPALAVNRNIIKDYLISNVSADGDGDVPSYIKFIIDGYSSTANFIYSMIGMLVILSVVAILSYKHKNLWILFCKVKKSISNLISEKYPDKWTYNSSLIAWLLVVFSILFPLALVLMP